MLGDVEDPAVLDQLEGPFDCILLSDTIGSLDDVQATLSNLHRLCHPETRVIISYYNRLWAPVLRVGQWMGLQMPQREQNWLSGRDIANILMLADFDVVRLDSRQLLPRRVLGLGRNINRYLGTLPGFRSAALRSYVVARSLPARRSNSLSASIIVPCRNEAGNVAAAVERPPPGRPRATHVIGRTIELAYQGQAYTLDVSQLGPQRYRVEVDGQAAIVDLDRLNEFQGRLVVGGRRHQVSTVAGTGKLPRRGGRLHPPDHPRRGRDRPGPGAGRRGLDAGAAGRRGRGRRDGGGAREHEDGDRRARAAGGCGPRGARGRQLPGRRRCTPGAARPG